MIIFNVPSPAINPSILALGLYSHREALFTAYNFAYNLFLFLCSNMWLAKVALVWIHTCVCVLHVFNTYVCGHKNVAACQVAGFSTVCYVVDCHVHYCLSQNRIYNSRDQCVDAGWRKHERDYQIVPVD